ncbi:MAG: DUF2975 domain-containing protein [Phycisphaerales bacterium]
MINTRAPVMKRSSTAFLQFVIVLVGIAAAAILLWEPHLEGRNAHATVFEVYFKDPFLAYAYVAAIPFFTALYQTFRVLGFVGRNEVFSPAAVRALRTIKYCAIAVMCFVVGGLIFILMSNEDDKAGGIVIGIVITFAFVVVAAAAATFERVLQNAVEMKSENDLTV